ncbi:hypothetical protein ACFSO7_00675 [Bacillus sp. CGMCC 1.16607]|uniref:hypothetical protein n=1 Tax=Bacillus sp. CGMCC 1.16607 TaxID=3351842 RepID=UPI0036330CCD
MRVLRFVLFTVIVMLVEFGLSYLLSYKAKIPLIDAMFYAGVFFTVIFIYFSSTGGFISNVSQSKIARSYVGLRSNYKFQKTFGSLSVNYLNVGSVLYLLICFFVGFL